MIVDSTVWIPFFLGTKAPEIDQLKELIESGEVKVLDVILMETLRAMQPGPNTTLIHELMRTLNYTAANNEGRILLQAKLYLECAEQRVPINDAVDLMIAAYCIDQKETLLTIGEDFAPFAHLMTIYPETAL